MIHFASKTLATLAAFVALFTQLGVAHAQLAGRPLPQDTTHAIEGFDILGVRLGMPEADAIAAIKSRLDDSVDSGGNKVHLKTLDYVLRSPVTHAPVRAGVRFERDTGTPAVGDAARLLIVDGRVWGVWRNDVRGHYDYERMLSDLTEKYAGAGQIPSLFDRINGGRRENGGTGMSGMELYQGHCDGSQPFAGASGSIRLEPGCSKVLWVNYGLIDVAGVRSMNAGTSQLVDLDAGRRWFESMNGVAAQKAREANLRGGAAKL
jgi:hypothetical protein